MERYTKKFKEANDFSLIKKEGITVDNLAWISSMGVDEYFKQTEEDNNCPEGLKKELSLFMIGVVVMSASGKSIKNQNNFKYIFVTEGLDSTWIVFHNHANFDKIIES